MDRVTIPVTKSFSVQQDDIIGTLEIDESIADQIAAFAAEKLEMRLETSIQRKDGKWVLHLVSFGSVPAERLPGNDRLCRSSAEADGYGTQEQGGTK